jgi:hypothetical protein
MLDVSQGADLAERTTFHSHDILVLQTGLDMPMVQMDKQELMSNGGQ